MHGPDVLIDTPEESKLQLNRSQVGRDRGRALLALASRPHRRPAGLGVAQLRLPLVAARGTRRRPLYIPERVWADFEANYGLADQFRFLERQGTVAVEQARRGRAVRRSATFTITPVPLEAENAYRVPVRGRGQAGSRRDGRDARLDAARRSGRSTSPCFRSASSSTTRSPASGMIPEEFCKPPVRKTRYGQALEQVRALAPRRAVLSHIEEMDRRLARRARRGSARRTGGSPRGTGSWSSSERPGAPTSPGITRLRRAGGTLSTPEPTDLGR